MGIDDTTLNKASVYPTTPTKGIAEGFNINITHVNKDIAKAYLLTLLFGGFVLCVSLAPFLNFSEIPLFNVDFVGILFAPFGRLFDIDLPSVEFIMLCFVLIVVAYFPYRYV